MKDFSQVEVNGNEEFLTGGNGNEERLTGGNKSE
jgi:hypothetical protein